MKMYNLIIDDGKPFEETLSYLDLVKRLKDIRHKFKYDDNPIEIFIYDDETKEDVTEKIFEDLENINYITDEVKNG